MIEKMGTQEIRTGACVANINDKNREVRLKG